MGGRHGSWMLVLIVAAAATWGGAADRLRGDAVTLIDDSRFVRIEGSYFDEATVHASAFALFDVEITDFGSYDPPPPEEPGGHVSAGASQASSVSTGTLMAIGRASSNAMGMGDPDVTAEGESWFEVTFSVADWMEYSLSGNLSGNAGMPHMPDGGMADSELLFVNSAGERLLDVHVSGFEYGVPVYASGVLPPDTYTIIASCRAWADGMAADGNASASYDLNLQLIPEPATLALLAMGGLALIRWRRSHSTH